jgi:predicted SAM-dependent methyltransferase
MFTSEKRMHSYITYHASRFFDSLEVLRKGVTTPISKVLDIGCRPYLLSLILQKEFGWTIFGVNDGPDEVYRGIKTYGLDISKTRLPVNDEQYDLIIFSEVLEHLLNPAAAMKEIYRILKMSGYFFLSTPNATKLSYVIRTFKGRTVFDKISIDSPYARHNREYTMKEAQNLLSSFGFISKIVKYTQYKRRHRTRINYMLKDNLLNLILKFAPHFADRIDVLAVKKNQIKTHYPPLIYKRPDVNYRASWYRQNDSI